MTREDRLLQAATLNKYRTEGIIPTMQTIRTETGMSITTIATFMSGNSANEAVRTYLRDRLTKNLVPLPKDVLTLFAVWEKDKH